MSDGPHRSLPMRSGWRRVAQCGDNRAFAPEDVSNLIVPALEGDCRADLRPGFVQELCGAYLKDKSSLFKSSLALKLESLRPIAGYGVGQSLLDHAIQMSENGETGRDGAEKAMTAALSAQAARGARQVEEHYLRASTRPRAVAVRARIEEGIRNAHSAIKDLARRMLRADRQTAPRPPQKRGLDDGVMLK